MEMNGQGQQAEAKGEEFVAEGKSEMLKFG